MASEREGIYLMTRHRHYPEIKFAINEVFRAVTEEEPDELIAALRKYDLYIIHDDELEDLQSELEDLVGTRAKKFKDVAKDGIDK